MSTQIVETEYGVVSFNNNRVFMIMLVGEGGVCIIINPILLRVIHYNSDG